MMELINPRDCVNNPGAATNLRKQADMHHDTKDVTRFWGHADKTAECWNWTRAKNGQGYAFFKLKGKMVLGHRFAWTITYGDIPAGLVVDHKCRNRICVNPAHLQAVSSRENVENLDPTSASTDTGHLNVYKRKHKNGYVVIVRSCGKKHYGGSHATLEAAVCAARDLRNRVKTNNLQDRYPSASAAAASDALDSLA